MDEAEFNDLLDCNFPYNDRTAALALFDRAKAISPNAMFLVLDEICRPGVGVSVSKETLLELIDVWAVSMDHPLSAPVVSVARIIASGSECSVPAAAALMEKVAQYKGQYAALSIAYMSCNDSDNLLEARESDIRTQWGAG